MQTNFDVVNLNWQNVHRFKLTFSSKHNKMDIVREIFDVFSYVSVRGSSVAVIVLSMCNVVTFDADSNACVN